MQQNYVSKILRNYQRSQGSISFFNFRQSIFEGGRCSGSGIHQRAADSWRAENALPAVKNMSRVLPQTKRMLHENKTDPGTFNKANPVTYNYFSKTVPPPPQSILKQSQLLVKFNCLPVSLGSRCISSLQWFQIIICRLHISYQSNESITFAPKKSFQSSHAYL